jgi:hypothetical protein
MLTEITRPKCERKCLGWALQLQGQLSLGSYRSAWLLCGKLRRSMVAPGRSALAGLVERNSLPQQGRSARWRRVAAATRARC